MYDPNTLQTFFFVSKLLQNSSNNDFASSKGKALSKRQPSTFYKASQGKITYSHYTAVNVLQR